MHLAALDRTCLIYLGLCDSIFLAVSLKIMEHVEHGQNYSLIPKAAEMVWQSCSFSCSLEKLIVEPT